MAALTAVDGVEAVFDAPAFHERVLRLCMAPAEALKALAAHNVLGGFDLSQDYPELGDALLVCATELRTGEEIDNYAAKLSRILTAQGKAKCPVEPKFDK